jgi:putative ABC transport system permease protein
MGWTSILLALREIRRNLMRSFLTVLGIVIGVSSVITMVTLGNGATQSVSAQISSLGSNLIMLRPGQQSMGPGSSGASAPNFKIEDANAIRAQIGSLNAVSPTAGRNTMLVAGTKNWSSTVTGSNSDYFVAGSWTLASGRIFNDAEERSGKAVCVIGATVLKELFNGQNPLGNELRVKQFSCEVIGVLVAKGQSSMGRDQDDTVIMPLRTVQRRLLGSQDISSIMISVKDGASTEQVIEQIKALMRERRKISENEDDNFSVLDTKEIAQTLSGAIGTMTALLGAVAAVSLLVGGIGIMNIMLVSVTERTREIGIRLAIGALEEEVLMQFLTEAVALSAFGGLIGILLAALACFGLSSLLSLPFAFSPGVNLLAFGFSAAIGVIFGYVPAKRAAQLDPIEALRRE